MTYKVRTPLFPLYHNVRSLMGAIIGVEKRRVVQLNNAIKEQTGSPQRTVDWGDPDSWIVDLLTGDAAGLALRVWHFGDPPLNPRHMYGAYLFINNYGLLKPDLDGKYQITAKGDAFLAEQPDILQELDSAEGLLYILELLSVKEKAKTSELLTDWHIYLQQVSKNNTQSTAKDALRRRLQNLVERKLIGRAGNYYHIVKQGRDWLSNSLPAQQDEPTREVLAALNAYNVKQKEALHHALCQMTPLQFERLIAELLEVMGYQDVEVTKPSGDLGVDVVANVQVGITTVREVVQVKRMAHTTLTRPFIDQLRGALPYHKAIRGTLITLGRFAKSCAEAALFPGASPITLIDGERLIALLIAHEVGIRKRSIEMLEVDFTFAVEHEEYKIQQYEFAD
ncbi:restriction endonuclease [Zooshikella harenae]|uniref:Restriction endonuclease n=1 Tax=Zooshikella harenae TaxID=2827238 RepID=A0ABS5ZIF9_9GAMM|nr:restriction endonuclease [Zooshikella harenae]MBU2713861.1 restriction endonuclease [Zooshikella harenae]